MDRRDFGQWGIELDSNDFACALADLMRVIYYNSPRDVIAKLVNIIEPASQDFKKPESRRNLAPLCFDSTILFNHFDRLDRGSYSYGVNFRLIFERPAKRFSDDWQGRDDHSESNHESKRIFLRGAKEIHTFAPNYPQSLKLRLEIYANRDNAVWLAGELSREAVGASSVYIRTDNPGTEVGWEFPLRVGFLSDAQSQKLHEEIKTLIQKRLWLEPLVELLTLGVEHENCDLLLIPAGLKEGLGLVLNLKTRISADCVLLLGRLTEDLADIPAMVDAFRRIVKTSGVGLVPVKPEKLTEWFTELITEISHNQPIDIALFEACRRVEANPPVLIASRQLIEFSLLSESVKTLGEQLKAAASEERRSSEEGIKIDDRDTRSLRIEEGNYSLGEMSQILIDKADDFDYSGESMSATSLTKIKRKVKEILASGRHIAPKARWIQAQVYELNPSDGRVQMRRALRLGSVHEFVVRIGTQSAEWENNAEEFDTSLLPAGKESYNLTVVFTELSGESAPVKGVSDPLKNIPSDKLMSGKMIEADLETLKAISLERSQSSKETVKQVAYIVLPSEGNSTECRFFLNIRQEIQNFEARISILYLNRILQTCLIKAPVSTNPSGVSAENGIEVLKEVIVRSDFSELKKRKHFDAAFVLNHTAQGKPGLTAIKDKYVSFSKPDTLDAFVNRIDTFLKTIADNPDDYAGSLENPATVRLLTNLAKYGHGLYESLKDYEDGNSPLAGSIFSLLEDDAQSPQAKRIQVISANPDTRLPFEFLYDHPSPKDGATLCPQATDALKRGYCLTDCPGLEKDKNHVCPMGFWGLSKVIERHTHDTKFTTATVGGDFRFQTEPVEGRNRLDLFNGILFAASDKANVVLNDNQQTGIESLVSTIKGMDSSLPDNIKSWDEWRRLIKLHKPSTLVLLTHTKVAGGGVMALEIKDGTSDDMLLELESIESEHLRDPPENPPPLVLLIGCETGNAKIEFMGFVSKLRRKGAAIIVSTGVTIRGRHAVPVTTKIINLLDEYSKKNATSFGEVMRIVKQQLLADGIPMVLTLMTYGDADWQIGT